MQLANRHEKVVKVAEFNGNFFGVRLAMLNYLENIVGEVADIKESDVFVRVLIDNRRRHDFVRYEHLQRLRKKRISNHMGKISLYRKGIHDRCSRLDRHDLLVNQNLVHSQTIHD